MLSSHALQMWAGDLPLARARVAACDAPAEKLLHYPHRHARGRFHKVLFPYRLMSPKRFNAKVCKRPVQV